MRQQNHRRDEKPLDQLVREIFGAKKKREGKILLCVMAILVSALVVLSIVYVVTLAQDSNDNSNYPETTAAPTENTTYSTPNTTPSSSEISSTTPNTTTTPNVTETPTITPEPTPEPISPIHGNYEILYNNVIDWQIYTGDFREEQMEYLIMKCEEYEISVEFMLGIICTESSFRSYVKSKNSSASGYCQVIASTREWVYENLLKRGTYDIDNHVAMNTTDWRLNIDLGTRLVKWLLGYWGNYQEAAEHYFGSTSAESNRKYANKVSSNLMDLFGHTISDIDNGKGYTNEY